MKKRIIPSLLALLMIFGTGLIPFSGRVRAALVYPELIITEIGADQYGEATNAKNTNSKQEKNRSSI